MRYAAVASKLLLLLGLTNAIPAAPEARAAKPDVAVVVDPAADDLEQLAAAELAGYLHRLYGIQTRPASEPATTAEVVLLVGNPNSSDSIKRALGDEEWPRVTEQGIVIRPTRVGGKPGLIVGGGTPRATLWAVHELAERWGVRHLLHGDVLPEEPGEFVLPDKPIILEPSLPIRQWRVMNAHACGPESWGMADYRPVVDQLAKLKFNRIFIYIWPWHPFVHFQVGGIERNSAGLWFGYHYPVTPDMPGRRLFGDAKEFWNPDLPIGAGYPALRQAGEKLLHEMMAHARRRGMECVLVANLGEFPAEFAPLLKNPQTVHQIGVASTIVPGADTPPDDPAFTKLATAVLQATAGTYPEADFIELGMQEHRQWTGHYEAAWKALDKKYGIEKVAPLASVLQAATQRTGYPGGEERPMQEVKGDIVALQLYDRLLTEQKALDVVGRGKPKLLYDGVAEELFPVLPNILPAGSETLNFIDYTPSRILKRRSVIAKLAAGKIPATLIYTLHDDNVGLLPQLATGSLHELTLELRRHGWAGFSTRYWLLGDHDPCVAYLAKAAWDPNATPANVYADHVRSIYGERSLPDMLALYGDLEAATLKLEQHGLGFAFPTPQMLMQHWASGPLSAEMIEIRRLYQSALAAARRARETTRPAGRPFADYWIGRLEFGVGYLDAVETLRRAATAERDKNLSEASREADAAVATLRQAIDAYANVAVDRSDVGAVAVLAEYAYRPLAAKAKALQPSP